jgi:hypothetical protein
MMLHDNGPVIARPVRPAAERSGIPSDDDPGINRAQGVFLKMAW